MDANTSSSATATPLMLAAEAGDAAALKQLIGQKLSTTAEDGNQRVALHYAANSGVLETLHLLHQANSSIVDHSDAEGFTPLTLAVIGGFNDMATFLLDKGADVNHVDADKHSLLQWAVVCGHLDVVATLLGRGALPATPDLSGAHALHYATQLCAADGAHSAMHILRALLVNGARLNARDMDGRAPLLWAASCGSVAAIEALLEAGADKTLVDKDGLSALHCAASRGYSAAVDALLSASVGVRVNAADGNGATPLFYAVSLGHVDCARALLQRGALPDAQDSKRRTAAHYGAARAQLAALHVLDRHGASFELQNHRGDLPLHEAVQTGATDVVQWLLNLHPSTVNAENFEGRTALHLAAAAGYLNLCQLLCESGAETNPLMLVKENTFTPLDLAESMKRDDVADYLRSREGNRSADLPETLRKKSADVLQIRINSAGETKAPEVQSESSNPSDVFLDELVNRREERRAHRRRRKLRRSAAEESQEPEKSFTEAGTLTVGPELLSAEAQADLPSLAVAEETADKETAKTTSRPTDDNSSTERRERKKMKKKAKAARDAHEREGESVNNVEKQTVAVRTGHRQKGRAGRYMEEKRIFEELTRLKRMQIQYGGVQEAALVRRLTDDFARFAAVAPDHFQFKSFNAWEKFLYNQLTSLYDEERSALTREQRAVSRFERRLSTNVRGEASNARVDQLIRTYGVAPLPLQYSPNIHRRIR